MRQKIMIQSKKDYKYYLKCDYKATGIYNYSFKDRIREPRFKFYKSLRLTEYYTNCRKDFAGKFFAFLLRWHHDYLCNKYGWIIPINVFKEGLSIMHVGTIVVSGNAKIGKNCRIHVCVNIGQAYAKGKAGAPNLGDNVYIAPGVKLFGPIIIGDNTAIGANAVVNESFPDGNCTIAGIPAKKISDKTSDWYIAIY